MTQRIALLGMALVLLSLPASAESQMPGFAQDIIRGFEQSDFVFPRGQSNAPLFPLASVTAQNYSNTEVKLPNGERLTYDVAQVSQNAMLPILIGEKDALIIGEYVSLSNFDIDQTSADSFDVTTVGVPLGWFRQANESWQLATFVMPMGHKSSEHGSDWSWQYLGGAFSRYVQNDQLWWAFGFYFDIAPDENFYIPYLGASWTINERWTLSAILPWPGVIYSPTQDWSFRLGAAPSGASWSVSPAEDEISFNINTWDFGVSANRRLGGNLWLGLEAGYGGLGSLSFKGSDVENPEFDIGSNLYMSLSLKFRPELR